MIREQESKLLAKIDSLQSELSKKMDDLHKETQESIRDIKLHSVTDISQPEEEKSVQPAFKQP